MFKGLIITILLIAGAIFGISKGYHTTIANFGNSAKPIADVIVYKVEKSFEDTKEVTNKVATEVKDRTK